MKRLAIALAIATLALAASTLYLAQALKLERAHTDAATTAAPQPARPDAIPATADETANTSTHHTTADTSTVDMPTPPEVGPTTRQQQPEQRAEPAAHAANVADIKAAVAPMMKDMMEYAGLDAYESGRLLDLAAEAMVRGQELSRECKSTPGCDIRPVRDAARESQRRDIERMIGADKMRRLDIHDEIQRVKSFRTQQPAGQELSETTVTQLATQLAKERYRRTDGTESTPAFNQRMYDRAAGVLTGEQLAFFKQRQESSFGRD